jgi:hypothetical protein
MQWVLMILIVIGVLAGIFLIYKNMEKSRRDALDKTVGIVGFFVTVISLVGGVYTYYENIIRQNEVSAYGIYQEVIKMNLDDNYKEFLASGRFPKYKVQDIQNLSEEDKKMYEKYQWFVGSNLFQFESIFALDDPGWEETVVGFIEDQQNYISNNGYFIGSDKNIYRFPCERYTCKIQALISKTISKDCPKKQ